MKGRAVPDGERKTITALFADLKGSTALIEGLDPEEARAIIDPALHIMMDAVHRYEGYVAQALGDGIFALFGAPIAHEDHPQRALFAALRMQEEMRRYSDQLREQGRPPLLMRVGVNTGEVVVRSIRKEDLQTDYVPVGHSTNLAARMEQLAAPGSILVTEQTHKLTSGYFEFKALGKTQVKGVEEPLNIYEVIGAGPLRTRLQVSARRGLTRFVGRHTELDQTRRALEQARAGHGQIVGVMGEPGVGKSRLFYECKLTSQSGCLLLESFSVSHGKASSYLPVIELLKSYFQIQPHDEERNRRQKVIGKVLELDRSLEDILPYLFVLLGIEEQTSALQQMDAQIRRRRTFDALKRLFLRESLNQPVILIFEDLHWIDTETQGFLDTLSESIASARILLLVNYRPEYRHEWGQKTYYTKLRLAPLGKDEVGELLTFLLGDEAGLKSLKQLILEKTEGTPFFIEEVVQTLAEEGVLSGERGAYRLGKAPTERDSRVGWVVTHPTFSLHLPPTVQGVLTARIDRLATAETTLLHQLAVIGRQFPLSLVHHVVNYSELAHHYSRSGNTEKAVDYLQLAGQQAVQRSANAEAINLLTAALELLKTLPDTSERAQQELTLQIALGAPLIITKGYAAPEVEHAYARAQELCQQVGETPQIFPVLWGLLSVYATRAEFQTAHKLGEQLLSLAQDVQDPLLLVEAHFQLGITLYMLGEFGPAREHLEQGIALYNPQQHGSDILLFGQDLGVSCFSYGASVLWFLGYPDQALKSSRDALTLAHELAHPLVLAYASGVAAILHQFRWERQAAQERAEAAITLSTEQGFPLWLAWGTGLRGWALAEQGWGEEGIAQMRQSLAANRAIGAELGRTYLLALLAEAYGKAWQTEEGLTVLLEALAAVENTGERDYEAELYRLKGELTLQSEVSSPKSQVEETLPGRVGIAHQNVSTAEAGTVGGAHPTVEAEAEHCFLKAIKIARKQQAKSLELRAVMSLARLWQQQGKQKDAHQMLAEIYGWFTEGFDTADLQEAKALLQELRH
ncbi:MAG: AAA family ATPase [Deltaproteobacteria bacterium]|nr:AAA family ATPase [Deltaproteobacteria bacterium]